MVLIKVVVLMTKAKKLEGNFGGMSLTYVPVMVENLLEILKLALRSYDPGPLMTRKNIFS